MIVYEPSLGFKWTPSDADRPAIQKLYRKWEESALHYLCLFSHPCSPYITIGSDEERNEMVIGEMKAKKWGKKTSAGATTYPNHMYQDTDYMAAADEMLDLKSIPDFMEVVTISRQIDAVIADEKLLKPSSNAKEAAEILKVKKDIQALLSSLYKQKAEAGERFRKQCSHAGLITPDEIWAMV